MRKLLIFTLALGSLAIFAGEEETVISRIVKKEIKDGSVKSIYHGGKDYIGDKWWNIFNIIDSSYDASHSNKKNRSNKKKAKAIKDCNDSLENLIKNGEANSSTHYCTEAFLIGSNRANHLAKNDRPIRGENKKNEYAFVVGKNRINYLEENVLNYKRDYIHYIVVLVEKY